jgi:hypothetical protein
VELVDAVDSPLDALCVANVHLLRRVVHDGCCSRERRGRRRRGAED